jgi:outer membrane protein
MIPMRVSPFLRSARGFFLCQLIGAGLIAVPAYAQAPKDGQSVLPGRVGSQSLNGLEAPPQMVIVPRAAIPNNAVPGNLTGNNTNGSGDPVASDLIQLYQEAAFSDPVLNTARFNYQASKERFWQGLSLLLPQAAAVPVGTRYFQHTGGGAPAGATTGSRVYDQKSYTVTLTQPVFNVAALEAFKQGDLNTKIADMQFYAAQQDLIIRVSQAYFDALNSQDNVELYLNKKSLIKKQLEVAKAKFDAGLATIVDVNTAQASLDLASSQEIAAQADLIVKRGVLEQLTGRPVGMLKPLRKEAKIDGVLKDPRSKSKDANTIPIADSVNPQLPKGQTLDDWIRQAEAANFNVLAGQLSISLAESTYKASQALDYPSLNFVGTTGYNTSNGVANSLTPAQTNIYNNTIALQMTIPLVSGGYNSSVIRQNAALLDAAKSTYDNYRRTAAQNTRAAFTGFYGGLASVQAFEAAERSSSSALESSQLGFQVGTLINLDVLIALDTVISTRSQLQQARYNTILNAIKLKAHVASLSDEDLIAINTLLR